MLLSNIAIVGTWIRDGRSYNKIAIQVTLGMRRVWCVVPALDGLDVFFCFFFKSIHCLLSANPDSETFCAD